jgi:hypothetical protein
LPGYLVKCLNYIRSKEQKVFHVLMNIGTGFWIVQI